MSITRRMIYASIFITQYLVHVNLISQNCCFGFNSYSISVLVSFKLSVVSSWSLIFHQKPWYSQAYRFYWFDHTFYMWDPTLIGKKNECERGRWPRWDGLWGRWPRWDGLWDSTSDREENETFFVRVWKPLPSKRILKILRESLKGKAQRGQCP